MNPQHVVYVVDNDPEFLESCRYLLGSANFDVETFDSGSQFLEAYQPGFTCCLLLDVVMPEVSGLDVLEKIRKHGWIIPTIVMTAFGRVQDAVQAMKLRAIDFLEKPFSSTQRLIDLVQQALETQIHQQHAQDSVQEIQQRLNLLSIREREVLEFVVDGLSNLEICSRLGTQPRTVETQRGAMMSKMEADSLAHLVRMVMKYRIGTKLSLSLTAVDHKQW